MAILPDGDIESAIIDALKQTLNTDLVTNIDQSDPLRLKRLDLAPLQDDPTQVAPYVVFSPSYQLGRRTVDQGGWEIGGMQLWRTFFMAMCGTPRKGTKDLAYKAINELSRRVEVSLYNHWDLSNILAPGRLNSPDKSEWIDAIRPEYSWVQTARRVYGGDQEFYGSALLVWNYTFRRPFLGVNVG